VVVILPLIVVVVAVAVVVMIPGRSQRVRERPRRDARAETVVVSRPDWPRETRAMLLQR